MSPLRRSLLSLMVIAAINSSALEAATDEERIRRLEAIVEKQQHMIDAMNVELQRLRGDQAVQIVPVDRLDSVAQQPAEASPVVIAGATHPDANPPLSMNIYGFVMADAIYDFKRVDPSWEDTLRVTTIPTRSGAYGEDGNFTFGVRQSRLGVSGSYGEDVTYILEAELFGVGGDEGQTTPRLRHAWATYKNLGAGQYWSNFMDIDIFPNTIDYWGPTGMVFYRNQQLRYSFPMAGGDEFSISLEDPGTALTVGKFRNLDTCDIANPMPDCESIESTLGDLFQAHNDVPDLTARYRNNGDHGHVQLAGIVRKLGYERLDTGEKDHELGWGVNTSTGLRFF